MDSKETEREALAGTAALTFVGGLLMAHLITQAPDAPLMNRAVLGGVCALLFVLSVGFLAAYGNGWLRERLRPLTAPPSVLAAVLTGGTFLVTWAGTMVALPREAWWVDALAWVGLALFLFLAARAVYVFLRRSR